MLLIHNIGPIKHNSNYNNLEEIIASNEPLSFDGVYRNVYENWESLKVRDVKLFVMGFYVGGDNAFDKGMPLEKYCTWNELFKMQEDGAEIGWHTKSHRDLTTLTREEIVDEITPPFPMDLLAYPYGRFNDLVIECAKQVGYKDAFSVDQGNGEQFQRLRHYL